MPLSVFTGTRAPGERWTNRDTQFAIALQVYEAGLCPGCGHPMHESMALDSDAGNPFGEHYYEAGEPARCHACTAAGVRAEQYRPSEDNPVNQPQALHFSTVRKERE